MANIISWNVKGLRSPHKRGMILRHLKKLKPDIALLQETHLEEIDFKRMCKLWVGEEHGSAAKGRTAGTLILLRKGLTAKVITTDRDEEGRRISIVLDRGKGTTPLTITNVYAPNSPSVAYFAELTSWMATQNPTHHIVGGDFNCTIQESEDRPKLTPRQGTPQPTPQDTPLQTFTIATNLTDI